MQDRAPMLGQLPGQQGPIKKLNASWKTMFLGCAAAVIAGALLGLFSMVGVLVVSPFDIIIFSYLLIFGIIMLALDLPVEHPRLTEMRLHIFKFCLFLTRFSGRGITYIFLGCMICGNLWDNSIAPFMGFIIFGALSATGVLAIHKGMGLSNKLGLFKRTLKQRNQPAGSICPPAGLHISKFGELALATCGVSFTTEELSYIANALSQTIHADEMISQREFEFWMQDPTPVLI